MLMLNVSVCQVQWKIRLNGKHDFMGNTIGTGWGSCGLHTWYWCQHEAGAGPGSAPLPLHYKHQGPVHNAENVFSDDDLSRKSRWKDWTPPHHRTALLDMDTSGVIKEWDCHLSFPLQNRSTCISAHSCCNDPTCGRKAERGALLCIK